MSDRIRLPRYVLVTPAHNEESTIEQMIQSVVAQSEPPLAWAIVSDGSTDRTDEIVKRYAETYAWIHYVRLPEHRDRQFAAKVGAFNAGYEVVRDLDYEVVGNLDADITFGPEYFGYLLGKFAENESLGVAGTPFEEDGAVYDYRFTNVEHVSGACQLFRRGCFEEIGGYQPIRGGGIDWVAVTTARMRGWQTRTFTDLVCHHHRKMGTGNAGRLASYFRHGRKDYALGGHPAWQLIRSLYQMTRSPFLVGGLLLLAGYTWAALHGEPRPISDELMHFHRSEQMSRLKAKLMRTG